MVFNSQHCAGFLCVSDNRFSVDWLNSVNIDNQTDPNTFSELLEIFKDHYGSNYYNYQLSYERDGIKAALANMSMKEKAIFVKKMLTGVAEEPDILGTLDDYLKMRQKLKGWGENISRYPVAPTAADRRIAFHIGMHIVNEWREVTDVDEFKEEIKKGGFLLCHWDGTAETEEKIKEETKATIRCIPLEALPGYKEEPGKCMVTGKPSAKRVVFAIAY